jgi:hypothetical protein
LTSLVRSSSAPAGSAGRARIVLLAAEGLPNAEIARRVGVTRQTVLSWRDRYRAGGVGALEDLDRSGRPPVHDEVAIVVATLEPPPAKVGVTHWSARLLADHLGISFATVARIWRKWKLQPWRVETFTFSTDPELDAKVRRTRSLTPARDPTRRGTQARSSRWSSTWKPGTPPTPLPRPDLTKHY